jgi:hypothetical protein
MKQIGLIIILSFIAFSCKKEKVPTSVQKSFYQSNGNFLVLKVGDELEAAYEYQLSSTSLSNDSLPLNWDSSDAGIDGMTMHYFLTFVPNEDTIIQHVNNYFSYNAQLIDTSILEKLTSSIAYNHSDFQVIASSNNVNDATIWSKIATLDIVKTYRTSNPTAKIGIQRIVENVYDPQFGFSFPIEKHLVFLVN